jgi:hypothetical protein
LRNKEFCRPVPAPGFSPVLQPRLPSRSKSQAEMKRF